MKIRFSNLGKIEQTELDLRPLTVIIGPNNSNKTYIAYSIYGLLLYGQRSFYRTEGLRFKHENDGSLSISVENILKGFITKDSKEFAQFFKRRLSTFFQDSSGQLFAKTAFDLDFSPEDIISAAKMLKSLKRAGPFSNYPLSVTVKDRSIFLRIQSAKDGTSPIKKVRFC